MEQYISLDPMEGFFCTYDEDHYPVWAKELQALIHIVYTDLPNIGQKVSTAHFWHPNYAKIIPTLMAAALRMANLEIPYCCTCDGRSFETDSDYDKIDEFDKTWARVKAFMYFQQVTFSNQVSMPKLGEDHLVYHKCINTILLGKLYEYEDSLIVIAWKIHVPHLLPFLSNTYMHFGTIANGLSNPFYHCTLCVNE